jgi:glucose/arabinose dehydrogenase
MRRTRLAPRLAAAGLLCGGSFLVAHAHPVFAPFDDTQFAPILHFGPLISLTTIATGLVAPNRGVAAPGDNEHLYVVDQPGVVWKVNVNTGAASVFLDVRNRIIPLGVLGPNTFDERGLLGLAFHPQFASNGLFYTYSSEPVDGAPTFPTTLPAGTPPDHQNVVAEWRVLPGGGIGERRDILRIDWPQFNHNGGDIAFGPDGKLYIPTGEGGNADDQGPGHGPNGNAQDLGVPLGKILRIDVDARTAPNGAYGVPADNPFMNKAGALRKSLPTDFEIRSGCRSTASVATCISATSVRTTSRKST